MQNMFIHQLKKYSAVKELKESALSILICQIHIKSDSLSRGK